MWGYFVIVDLDKGIYNFEKEMTFNDWQENGGQESQKMYSYFRFLLDANLMKFDENKKELMINSSFGSITYLKS